MRRIVLSVLSSLALVVFLSACKTFTSNPGSTISIKNNSSSPIHSVEVNYPGGVVGTPTIAAAETFRKWVPTKQCKLQIKFLDASNKEHPQKELDLGRTCPKELVLEIAPDLSVNIHAGQ